MPPETWSVLRQRKREMKSMSQTYPGVDRLVAILRDIRVSSCCNKHYECRYLQFCAELGRNVDLHVSVEKGLWAER